MEYRTTRPPEWTALLLAGGLGTRLRPVLPDLPKAMAPVAGRPFAEWLAVALKEQGIHRVVFCTGHLGRAIEEHFGDGRSLGLDIAYSREESPLGTAGALRRALALVRSNPVLAANADSYCPLDLGRLARAHAEHGARATLWLVNAEDSSRYGSVEIGDQGAVTGFREKSPEPRAGLISAGVYLFERAVLEKIPADRPESLEREVLPSLVGDGLYAVVGEGPFLDIGTPEAYERAESFFASVGIR